jgi:UDP-N-acetylglucosamine 2-epimerase (non-hydrolysing)
MKKAKKNILVVFGTRPEALKLAPLILQAKKIPQLKVWTCLTAQHREMVDQVMELFKLKPDFDLNLMQQGQGLSDLTARIFPKMDEVIQKAKPDVIVVQGDTTTAFVVALKAFYDKIPVAHVEAGLRTFNKYEPFPEEMNRVLVSRIADYHFAPTQAAADNLLREGIGKGRIFITGNTVVDALFHIQKNLNGYSSAALSSVPKGKRIIFVTAHRRESFGKPLQQICRALKDIVNLSDDVEIVYPVHLNPNVLKTVHAELGNQKRIHLIKPLSYSECLAVIQKSYFVLTDSGGIQEEAPSFQKPVLVMRNVSERNEGVAMKIAKLVGTDRGKILREAKKLISNPAAYQRMIASKNPYGDGKAASRILKILAR